MHISIFFLSEFASQVKTFNKIELFNKPGQHTFFVPVDKAFQSLGQSTGQTRGKELVTADVILGHVVPDKLLFTQPLLAGEHRTATYLEGEDVEESSIRVTATVGLTGKDSKGERSQFQTLVN